MASDATTAYDPFDLKYLRVSLNYPADPSPSGEPDEYASLVSQPVTDVILAAQPPLARLNFDNPGYYSHVTYQQLSCLELSASDAFWRAVRNLISSTPRELKTGSIHRYIPSSITPSQPLPNTINRLQGTSILIVHFHSDEYNSVRMLVPHVIDALAGELRIPVSQLLIVATFESMSAPCCPMFAAPCSSQADILKIFDFAKAELCHLGPLSQRHMRGGPAVSSQAFMMLRADHAGRNNSSIHHRYKPVPYPGTGQQHALCISSLPGSVTNGSATTEDDVVYMPWPTTQAQRDVLQQCEPILQACSVYDPAASPVARLKACFKCATGNATRKCSKCQTAHYCDRACQTADWTMKHRYFCSTYQGFRRS